MPKNEYICDLIDERDKTSTFDDCIGVYRGGVMGVNLFGLTYDDLTYYEILDNPYNAEFIELTSVKCPKCQRARVGNYRIIFYVSEINKQIEIIDIIQRKNDYRLF